MLLLLVKQVSLLSFFDQLSIQSNVFLLQVFSFRSPLDFGIGIGLSYNEPDGAEIEQRNYESMVIIFLFFRELEWGF